MSSLLRGSKKLIFGIGLAGCGAAAAVLFGLSDESRVAKASTIFSENFNQFPFWDRPSKPPSYKWDFNWDKREPDSLVKPLKGRFKSDLEQENKHSDKLDKAKAIATRHLILVRHGQYNLEGKTDEERMLTGE